MNRSLLRPATTVTATPALETLRRYGHLSDKSWSEPYPLGLSGCKADWSIEPGTCFFATDACIGAPPDTTLDMCPGMLW